VRSSSISVRLEKGKIAYPNLRNIHTNINRSERATTGDLHRTTRYNPDDIPNLTMKELHTNVDRTT
jgi:hypothetical protein